MSRFFRILHWLFLALLLLAIVAMGIAFKIYRDISASLPSVESLRQIELQEPMQVYAKDGRLMAIFGESLRYPVKFEEVPRPIIDAFLAAEDAEFYQHEGIDFKGIARAIWLMATTSDRRIPGGSTITMQVAKMFYQEGQKRDYEAKLAQMLLAYRIEQSLSKDEIFELYLNKSFFGHRSYGIAAAAEFYYGKTLDQLTLGEIATLVGTPKFPSSANPLTNPERNRERRNAYILPRMVQLGMVTQTQADAAAAEPMHAARHERTIDVYAPYVAEMVRQEMLTRYGADALERGYRVTTTIDPELQLAADAAVAAGLRIYDRRHGWRPVEQHFDLPAGEAEAATASRLRSIPPQAGSIPVIVLETARDGSATVINVRGERITLPPSAGQPWPGRTPASLYRRGDLARIRKLEADGPWKVDQIPRAQAALVSLNPDNGALLALVGGYSFAGNKFNRATQARRQPGSSFKPFIYAAAFERGYNPASVVMDSPVSYGRWRPQNDGGRFVGPIRTRDALVQSRNTVAVRLLDAVGVDYARRYISHFGIEESELPRNLSISLGTADLSPLTIARGYAVFANGGSRINPWFIAEVRDRNGEVVFKENPPTACRGCGGLPPMAANAMMIDEGTPPSREEPAVVDGFNFGALDDDKADGNASEAAKKPARSASASNTNSTGSSPARQAVRPPSGTPLAPRAMDERVAWQIQSMMGDVVRRGTATAARVLNREDIGGKTGSTNDYRDAWFAGYGGPYVTVVWVGRDDHKPLGRGEYGGRAALPIWISYMKSALKDQPEVVHEPPQGMIKRGNEWLKVEDQDGPENDNPTVLGGEDAPPDSEGEGQTPNTAPATRQTAPSAEQAYDIF